MSRSSSMFVRLTLALLVVSLAACGDDTGTGGGGVGGDDPVVSNGGVGGSRGEGCTPGDTLGCQCRDGAAGSKTCAENEIGETFFTSCELDGQPC